MEGISRTVCRMRQGAVADRAVRDDVQSIKLGSAYESVVASELIAHGHKLFYYDNRSKGEAYHGRDKDGWECDAVVHLRNGKYGLVEIKLGGDKLIEEGAKSLKTMEAKIDTGKMSAPSFLMALTGTGD